MKIMFGLKCDVNRVMKFHQILKFSSLVKYKTYQIMYKAHHRDLPKNLLSNFRSNRDTNSRYSKFNCNFKVEQCNSQILLTSMSCCGVRLWNSLPHPVKECTSLSAFKRNVKRLLS